MIIDGHKRPVSVIVITLNEEANIEYCLKSVSPWSDDIFVVDSFSEDNTLKIAERFTKNIYSVDRAHWADIRNWSMRNLPLSYEWVLFLDADEWLTEKLKNEISETLKTSKLNGFYIKRRFIFMGRWLKHGGLYVKILRLFKHEFAAYIANGDVEYARVYGEVGSLKHDIIHEDRKPISRWIEKHNKISDRAARQHLGAQNYSLRQTIKGVELEGGGRTRAKYVFWEKIPLVLRPGITFVYQYFFALGFLDGMQGLCYHLLQAFWYRLIIYVKVSEIQNDFTLRHNNPEFQ